MHDTRRVRANVEMDLAAVRAFHCEYLHADHKGGRGGKNGARRRGNERRVDKWHTQAGTSQSYGGGFPLSVPIIDCDGFEGACGVWRTVGDGRNHVERTARGGANQVVVDKELNLGD